MSRREWMGAALAMGAPPIALGESIDPFEGTIVLGHPTDCSVTVNVLFNRPQSEVYLECGDQPGSPSGRTAVRRDIAGGELYEQVIESLAPDRRYYYRILHRMIGQDGFSASAEHTFHTQRARGREFTFTVVADSHLFTAKHCNPERYALTLRNACNDSPDFHIDLGDTFRLDSLSRNPMDLTYAEVQARVAAHREYFSILTHSAPLFLVTGNHDGEYGYYRNPDSGFPPELPLWATNARKYFYPNPTPGGFYSGDTRMYPEVEGGLRESYYAWEWGDALFVVLDPYWEAEQKSGRGWGAVHGDEQYRWFRDTLRKSTARHKFVFEHHLHGESRGGVEVARLYEWGGEDQKGDRLFAQMRPGWEKPMHELMVETGVEIYFQGHDHLFAKGELDGVVYLTVPMPGAGPNPEGPYYFPYGDNDDAYPRSEVLPNSGHLRVTVDELQARVDYVRSFLPEDGGAGHKNGEVACSLVVESKSVRAT